MRRFAFLTGVLLLAAGCSSRTADETTPETTATPPAVSTTTSAVPSASAPPPTAAPGPDASPEAVARWVAAGRPADPADFQDVERDGETTQLSDDDVAFRLPGELKPNTLAGCIRRGGEMLSCLPGLSNPPSNPETVTGEWIGGWVDFDGSRITVGGYHGDPGPFNDGPGKPLPYGDSLRTGDYQCRSDPSGLYCVSLTHHTGLRMSETVTAYGCQKATDKPDYVGEQYDCGS